jgi:hypothetical protein
MNESRTRDSAPGEARTGGQWEDPPGSTMTARAKRARSITVSIELAGPTDLLTSHRTSCGILPQFVG